MNFVGVKLFRTTDFLQKNIFQMNDGDVFSTARLRKGIEQMKKLYGEFGYIDFVPEPSFDPIPNTDKIKAFLEELLTTAPLMARRCASSSSSVTWLSRRPSDHANPALVVASAGNPRRSRARAVPASNGLGMTKQPD